jgi:hypothetical protein
MYPLHPTPNAIYEGSITRAGMHMKRSIPGAKAPLFRPQGLDIDIMYDRNGVTVHDELTIPDAHARELLDDFGVTVPGELYDRTIEVHVSASYVSGIAKLVSQRVPLECYALS